MRGHLTIPTFNTPSEASAHWRSVRANAKRAGDQALYDHADAELKKAAKVTPAAPAKGRGAGYRKAVPA